MRKRIFFFFLDGIGLGANDPAINPFAGAKMPILSSLLNGRSLTENSAPFENERVSLLSLDACLNTPGLPQSATGQATILTGMNVPFHLGYHYGPKPNPKIAELLRNGNLFSSLEQSGFKTAFLNAYPPIFFDSIRSGRRLFATIPLAVSSAGVELRTQKDLHAGSAVSADFTAEGWRTRLGLPETPTISLFQAGKRLARLTSEYDFSFFEYWLSDYAGHGQDMKTARELLASFDKVLEGLLDGWDDSTGLILITSDHGNLEDLSTRKHTLNPVPLLIIGNPKLRDPIVHRLVSLADIFQAVFQFLQVFNTL